jgi:two-component system response regulator FixJ
LSQLPLIAIVEDDESLQLALAGLVRSLGYRACCYGSAEQFLASADAVGADCVTTDVQMGAISGYDLARCLRSRRPQLPVIIITARPETEARDEAAACGALCLLRKPFDADVLATWIAHALAPVRF